MLTSDIAEKASLLHQLCVDYLFCRDTFHDSILTEYNTICVVVSLGSRYMSINKTTQNQFKQQE